MKNQGMILALAFAILMLLICAQGQAADPRFCGSVERDYNDKIARDQRVLREFKREYPCPSTKLRFGPCPGWNIDHIIPLACGGCDAMGNLQWLPVEIKRCAGTVCKDRWEHKVYCRRI